MAIARTVASAALTSDLSASKIGSSQRLALAAPVTRGAAARSLRVTTAASAAAMTPKALEKSWSKPQQATTKVDAPEYQQLEDLLSKYDFKFSVGDKVVGSVFNVEQRGAYIDVGAKAAAFLPAEEASLAKVERIQELMSVGETREFQIINENDAEGSLTLSLRRMQLALAWQRIAQIQAEDVTVYGEVLSANRGGLLVAVEGLRGFVPSSHLTMATPKEEMIGVQIPLKFIEADEERQRLVLSNKRAMADKQLEAFQVGDVVLGTVQSVQDYGAFVDIGGINGLLHISQISHERIDAVENVLTVGDQLKVMILSQDRERGRVSLSTRKLEPSPGDMIRDPQLVFDKADEMAATFRERVEAAEAAARAEEAALTSEASEE
mmetsp:Transcript_16374/g.31432  ORF Transcript_16374/g.31432 Transcript_16374/m.31432 type:complete len:380 (+) Transcript_16374:98-1237(+)|eukprot:CAMPEP_0114252358 /NCGR_PEP_ID=MMETSP0058-20121206/15789_1 /TAXON_ID=36894 /ORGANISM="Pyramimonas parkeae, CCMP726" /LENGTH=379 /DNA_ID=CAMNT_0001366277 /DNA_START=96 /DNA_END=1235 /DNA_ORIENTATION=-